MLNEILITSESISPKPSQSLPLTPPLTPTLSPPITPQPPPFVLPLPHSNEDPVDAVMSSLQRSRSMSLRFWWNRSSKVLVELMKPVWWIPSSSLNIQQLGYGGEHPTDISVCFLSYNAHVNCVYGSVCVSADLFVWWRECVWVCVT